LAGAGAGAPLAALLDALGPRLVATVDDVATLRAT